MFVLDKIKKICKDNNIEFKQENIRIDSHTHTHLIPIVWKALIEVIEENKYKVEYINTQKQNI